MESTLGEPPSPALDTRLHEIMGRGEIVELPAAVRQRLEERRGRARQRGPRVERHYWPGQPL